MEKRSSAPGTTPGSTPGSASGQLDGTLPPSYQNPSETPTPAPASTGTSAMAVTQRSGLPWLPRLVRSTTGARRDAGRFDIRDYIVYISFVVILVFFAITLRDTGFLSWSNFMTIVRETTPITVMAVGMVFVLSAGEIDLSIGAIVAVSSLVVALALRHMDSLPLAIAAGLGVGVVAGLVNGTALVLFRIPSFLVTLGTLSIFQGLARALTLEAVPIVDDTYNFWFGSGQPGGISILVAWSLVIVVLGYLVFNGTKFGRKVIATGGNRTAAVSVGIKVNQVKLSVFVISGVLAALGGMLYAGRLHGARYTLGETDLLTVIAAVVIGGTSLFGGRGSIVGALAGSITIGLLNNGLVVMGLSVSEQMMARGIIIIVAVALSLREARE